MRCSNCPKNRPKIIQQTLKESKGEYFEEKEVEAQVYVLVIAERAQRHDLNEAEKNPRGFCRAGVDMG